MTDRRARLRAALAEAGLDGILVTAPPNRRYLTGFSGSAGMVLVTNDRAALATDFRYWEQVETQTPDWELVKQRGRLAEWLPALLQSAGGKKIGFEAGHLTVQGHTDLRDAFAALGPGERPALAPTNGLVESLRAIKEPGEIAALERAVHLGDAAFVHVSERLEAGWTEQRVAWEIERYAREQGAEAMSFPTIVGGGPWGAMPHAYPREAPIPAGQPVVIDMGVIVDGYCSDLTRTIVIGKPDEQFPRLYDLVLTAQETAEATIEAGMSGHDAHMIAQSLLDEAGYGERFGHGLGHGVGLEIHESPRVGRNSEELLREGMVITVEPGVYLPGWGGIRIEDQGVIENGKLRIFTTAPKLRMVGV